jgi:hypothetical protein
MLTLGRVTITPLAGERADTVKTARRLCHTPVEELDEDEELIIDRAYCILLGQIRERTELQNKLKPLMRRYLPHLSSTNPEGAKECIELVAMLKKQQGQFLLLITEISFVRDQIYDR